jgi:hypothetical protein
MEFEIAIEVMKGNCGSLAHSTTLRGARETVDVVVLAVLLGRVES